MAIITIVAAATGGIAGDFRGAFLPAAEAIVDGGSPYAVAGYVYPPQLAFVLTPLTVLPHDVAALVALVASAGLLIATLAVLGVRDPLCYLAMFAWTPTWNELDMVGVTPALAFGLALVWRYRDRKWPPAIALALTVSTKVFLWPLFVWTLATRRMRLAVLAAGVGLAITIALWFVLGVEGLVDSRTASGHQRIGVDPARFTFVRWPCNNAWPRGGRRTRDDARDRRLAPGRQSRTRTTGR